MHKVFDFLSPGTGRIYFSGILGASLSSLALLCRDRGYKVGGSDTGKNGELIKKLEKNGINVFSCQSSENIEGYDVLVYSAAIPNDSPELSAARKKGLKIFSRSEFLGYIISEYRCKIGVSGTHGKSTVSGMITDVFLAENRDVTALIGAESVSLGGSLRIGNDDTVIYEACEYKRSFLDFPPLHAVVLNIETEHTDCYPTLSDAVEAYGEFIKNAKKCVLSYDDKGCRMLQSNISGKEMLLFSIHDKKADLYAENICCENGFYSFDTVYKDKKLFSVNLRVPGIHNVKNALAATAAALLSGVSHEAIKSGLEKFSGMRRRFEYIGECRGASVYDDYAHHPTEIRCTLDGAKKLGFEKIICAFQSHTYSRTAAFFKEFTEVFAEADEVIFTDIFAAREKNIYGVSGKALADATENGRYISDFGELTDYLRGKASPGTLIITMGAGRLNEVARSLTLKINNL